MVRKLLSEGENRWLGGKVLKLEEQSKQKEHPGGKQGSWQVKGLEKGKWAQSIAGKGKMAEAEAREAIEADLIESCCLREKTEFYSEKQ